LPIQGRSLTEWANRHTFKAEFVDLCWKLANQKIWSIDKYLTEAKTEGVAFMSTRSGYVGWAHNRAKPGDNIYLLPGCSVPVVLRHRVDRDYAVVGYAYVQGVMEGR